VISMLSQIQQLIKIYFDSDFKNVTWNKEQNSEETHTIVSSHQLNCHIKLVHL